MSKIKRLPDAELEIMNALWDADAPLTAAELETSLPGPPRARTTLLTLLARLEEKGCVTREKQGRGYLYTAALTRADHGGMLNTRELLDIAGVLTASRRVADYDAQHQGEETVLDRLFTSLHTNKYLEEQIRSAILDE